MDPSIKTEIEFSLQTISVQHDRESDGWRKYDPKQLNKNVLIFRCMIHSC